MPTKQSLSRPQTDTLPPEVFGKVLQGEIRVQRSDDCRGQRAKSIDVPHCIEVHRNLVIVLGEPPKRFRRRIDAQSEQVGGSIRVILTVRVLDVPHLPMLIPVSHHRHAVTTGMPSSSQNGDSSTR